MREAPTWRIPIGVLLLVVARLALIHRLLVVLVLLRLSIGRLGLLALAQLR